MDKALRPERLDVLPNAPDSSKVFNHWKKTFENYMSTFAAETNKLFILINLVSPDVYDLFSQDATYDTAIATLTNCYVKTPNEVYARHLLATRKQQPGESFDTYLTALRSLAKDCNFKPETAETYQNESIRDAFIAGTHSDTVHQRLLEKKEISLDEMIDTARSLESAEQQAKSYNFNVTAAVGSSSAMKQPAPNMSQKKNCWNCGNPKHARSRCPAKDAVCHNCSQMGHFAKFCKSKGKQNACAFKEDVSAPETESTTASIVFSPMLA